MVHQGGVVWGQAAPTSPRSLVSGPMRAKISAAGADTLPLNIRGRSGRGSVINGAE